MVNFPSPLGLLILATLGSDGSVTVWKLSLSAFEKATAPEEFFSAKLTASCIAKISLPDDIPAAALTWQRRQKQVLFVCLFVFVVVFVVVFVLI
jgi:hypothetical protein